MVKLGPALGAIFVAPAEAPMHLLVGTGDPAPTGGIFARFSERIGFDDSGRVAFGAFTKGTGSDFGIFVADGADRRAIAARGQAAPGGGVYASFGAWPAMSHTGAVAFIAAIDKGPASGGVFLLNTDGKMTRILAPGDPLMDGGKLTSLGLYPTVAVASDGSVSFLGIVERDGDETNAVLRYGPAPMPSRPGDLHPKPLTDPDLSLSTHPARAIARRLPPSVDEGLLSAKPIGPNQRR